MKVGETYLCPNCNHQFKSTKQILDEWKKGIDAGRSLIDFLSALSDEEEEY